MRHSHILTQLGRVLEEGTCADLSIVALGGSPASTEQGVSCHSLVLAAASPNFLAKLLREAASDHQEEPFTARLLLPGVSAEDLREALGAVYRMGQERPPSDGARECLKMLRIGKDVWENLALSPPTESERRKFKKASIHQYKSDFFSVH